MSTQLIPITHPSVEFDNHISAANNNRILFSGPFGIGKTTFVNEYFLKKPQFVTITLRPVNYAVASNEDIFKLIKYDILYQLMEKELVEIEDFGEFSKLDAIVTFMKTADLELITPFIESIPLIGGTVSKLILAVDKLKTKYIESTKDFKINQDTKKINLFLNEQKANHFLLENDFITEIIKSSIARINKTLNNENSGGVILIIDDLDRIDPEHIFRLFNIFSTHFEYASEYDNKFGFHRVIFVCDVVNIRSIFQNKYGLKTDFNGYIDKFYSTKIFKFDNKLAIINFVSQAIPLLTYNNNMLNSGDVKFLVDVLTGMLELEVTNLRNLKKARKPDSDYDIKEIYKIDKMNGSDFGYLYFTPVGMALNYLIGDVGALILLLEKCNERIRESQNKAIGFDHSKCANYLNMYFIPMLEFNKRGIHQPGAAKFDWPGFANYEYQFYSSGHRTHAIQVTSPPAIPLGITWEWLLSSIKVLRDNGMLN